MILLLACAPPPLEVTVAATGAGIEVAASRPVDTVEVLDARGLPELRRTLPGASAEVLLTDDLPAGEWTVRVRAGADEVSRRVTVEATPPARVEVVASPGGRWEAPGDVVRVPVVGERAEVLVSVVPGPGFPPELAFEAGETGTLTLEAPGKRVMRRVAVRAGDDLPVRVGDTTFRLVGEAVDLDALRADVTLDGVDFPTDEGGNPDIGRAAWRVTVAAPWWQSVTRGLGLGLRATDQWSAWGFAGVRFTNHTDAPVDLSVTLQVESDGAPAPAFRPRLRSGDGDTGYVSALLRVPANGDATAVLPVFVDPATVTAGAYTTRVEARPMGAGTALWAATPPLYVRAGDTLAGLGFAGFTAASLAGLAWSLTRLRRWLEEAATSELMTIALFGTALFVVGSASDVVAMGVGALLGPFSTLLTGVLQDAGRVALLATLLTLLPRPGTLALATLTGWLGRSLTTGGFSPTDVLYTGAAVAFAEGFAWLGGLTRRTGGGAGGAPRLGGWRDEGAVRRWARLSVAFGLANLCTTLGGLWMHIVLFRLYFADWYLALQALGPGFLYVVIACALAVPFAASLRKVEA